MNQEHVYATADLADHSAGRLRNLDDALVTDRIATLAALRELRRDIGTIIGDLEADITESMVDTELEVAHVGMVKLRREVVRTGWDHDGILTALDDAGADGRIDNMAAAITACAQIRGWKLRPLQALNIPPDRFCTSTERLRVDISAAGMTAR